MCECMETQDRIKCGKCGQSYAKRGNTVMALPGSPYQRMAVCPYCESVCCIKWTMPKLDFFQTSSERVAKWVAKKKKTSRPNW